MTAATGVLSAAEREAFARDGYLGPFRAFAPGEMATAHRTIRERVLPVPSRYSTSYHARHLDSRTVFALATAPAVVDRIAALLGEDLLLWSTHLFDKPPAGPDRPEEEFPWHQDRYTWRLEPMLTVSAWLALTPTTRDNGYLEVIPGSHRQEIPSVVARDPRYSLEFGGKRADPAHVDEAAKVAFPMDAGEFILFNETLLHHSNPNHTPSPRLGFAMRVVPPVVRVDEPFPCVLLRGRDPLGRNPLVEPPTGEPDDSAWWTGLPAGGVITFDRPVPGLGWYPPERDGAGWFCWSGPGPESWLDLRPEGSGAHVLRCAIPHAGAPSCLDRLAVTVNGWPLSFRLMAATRGVTLEGRIPARVLRRQAGRTRVGFRVPRPVRPCDVDPRSPDTRPLGIALHRVSFLPESVRG